MNLYVHVHTFAEVMLIRSNVCVFDFVANLIDRRVIADDMT